ncbi:MAG: PAS domain S-box protein [Desulfotignum sp.]|nr:PAS domain S-box protein [Desulfotignum sp.]
MKYQNPTKSFMRRLHERIQVQKSLGEQRAYFLHLFENSPQAIMIVAPDGKVVEANKGFENIFGYAVDEIKSRYSKNLIVPEEMIAEDENIS